MTLSNGDQTRVHVRLLATPERVKRELTGDANPELGLLRALWRGVGPALRTGAVVDLADAPASAAAPRARRYSMSQNRHPGVGAARHGYIWQTRGPTSTYSMGAHDRRRVPSSKAPAVPKSLTKECSVVRLNYSRSAARPRLLGLRKCSRYRGVNPKRRRWPLERRGRRDQ